MKRCTKQKLDRKDYIHIEILANIARIVLFPIFLSIRIYCWVTDYDYYNRFKH